MAALCLGFSGCKGRGKPLEVAYVSSPQVILRDRVAAVYEKTGVAKNGDRVQVLDRDRRFVKIRTVAGAEGWVEQRNLITQDVYDRLQKMAAQEQNDPVQAMGITRNDTNLHVDPGRDTDHLYQVSQGAKLSLLKRGTAEKPGSVGAKPTTGGEKPSPALEDWWLVRDAQGRVGWVLARMVDVDVPLDVAQYAEGQRIVAFFVLDKVKDGEQEVPQYLVALTEPKDGLPYDFDQIRVFTWNVRKHRYETAYREHGLDGVLPITLTQETFDKEGTLPVFVLRVEDDNGKIVERKYKLNTPIVRRVLAPGEQPSASHKPSATKKKRHR